MDWNVLLSVGCNCLYMLNTTWIEIVLGTMAKYVNPFPNDKF